MNRPFRIISPLGSPILEGVRLDLDVVSRTEPLQFERKSSNQKQFCSVPLGQLHPNTHRPSPPASLEETVSPHDVSQATSMPRELERAVIAPHIAPHSPLTVKEPIRAHLLRARSALQQSTDLFNDYMEDRLIHWRPLTSQYNVDKCLENKHPYQQQETHHSTRNPVSSLLRWARRASVSSASALSEYHLVNQTFTRRSYYQPDEDQPPQVHILPTPDLVRMLAHQDLRENSSKSFIGREPTIIENPTYTPQARPFSIYDFNKIATESPHDSLIDDLESFDGFFDGCLQGISNGLDWIKSMLNQSTQH